MEPHGTLWNLAEPCETGQKLLEHFLIQIKVESPVYISSSQVPYRKTTDISINFAHFLTVCLLSQPAPVQPLSPVTNNRRHCLTAVYTPYYYQSLYGLSIVATFRRLSLHGQPLALSTKACCDHPRCEPFLIQTLLRSPSVRPLCSYSSHESGIYAAQPFATRCLTHIVTVVATFAETQFYPRLVRPSSSLSLYGRYFPLQISWLPPLQKHLIYPSNLFSQFILVL